MGRPRLRKHGGGESGIRTHGATFGGTHDFQSCSFGQLGHLSASGQICNRRCLTAHPIFSARRIQKMAERVGFEPTIPGKRDTAFRERGLQPLGNLSKMIQGPLAGLVQ
jgi:hypothetical protein